MTSDATDEGVEKAAEQAEAELDKLQHHSDEVAQDIEQTRQDWKRRQQDSGVPGAQAPDGEDTGGGHPTAEKETPEEEVAGDWEGEGQGADEAGQ